MADIGKLNKLKIVKELDFGMYLDGAEHGEILLPSRYIPKNCKPGDTIEVFIYLDSEDRIIATTEKPYAMLGEFALLEAVSVTTIGAFLDWGLPKDLLVPYREQRHQIEKGKSYVVFIYLDNETERIVASTKIDQFLDNIPADYLSDQEVDLFIVSKTDIGYKAIINNTHLGILYQNEVFQPIKQGQKLRGFIKNIRDDGKIDLILQKSTYEILDDLSTRIIKYLEENGNFMAITDKSKPEIIYNLFKVSKKNYKKAIGALYKKRLIQIEENGIRLS